MYIGSIANESSNEFVRGITEDDTSQRQAACDIVQARRRKLFLVAKEIGLTRDERLEMSCYLLRRDVTTWKTLSDEQVCRLLDAFEGHHLVTSLLQMRPVDSTNGLHR
jgi:hypothetical protein